MSAKKNDDRKSQSQHPLAPLSAKLDASQYALTLIDPRPFRVILPATLRMIVSEAGNLATTDAALVPHHKLFHNGNGVVIQDSVAGHLPEGCGETVPYDVLILATGLAWAHPMRSQTARQIFKDFAGADSYVLVGGGAIGCELAGELKDIWPTKDVSIVHDRYRKRVANDLAKRGVKLLLNEIVLIDAVSLTSSLGPNVLTPAGFVKVKPTLQLQNFPNIFAAGDIIEWAEQKQAIKAQEHGHLMAKNVLAFRGGSSYFGVLWGIIIGGWLTAWIKSKDLLVGRLRGDSGLA
ncbi:hypothetical protein C8F01DRAFT_1213857 [Mycena amicta]|nr:hypothetical protein C8F01DRAFT_1213857 [Mycena amicta]